MPERSPKRRWFQFSLRTMFIVVTVFAFLTALVGYNLKWISERHRVFSDQERLEHNYDYEVLASPILATAPGILWLFREQGWAVVQISFAGYPEENQLTAEQRRHLDRIRRLYPESTVNVRSRVSLEKLWSILGLEFGDGLDPVDATEHK
jgi:hypothetical protein